MRCICLVQPWASLWLSTDKVHETRSWRTNHRGWLAVHASKTNCGELSMELEQLCVERFGTEWRKQLPRGAIIGAVNLIDCQATRQHKPVDSNDLLCGDWTGGRFAWKRGEFRTIDPVVPMTGKLGFFEVPAELFPWAT